MKRHYNQYRRPSSSRTDHLDGVVDVDDIAAVETRRRQRRDVDDVVVEGVVAGLHLAARDAEYVALAAVFRRLRPHVDYLPQQQWRRQDFTPAG